MQSTPQVLPPIKVDSQSLLNDTPGPEYAIRNSHQNPPRLLLPPLAFLDLGSPFHACGSVPSLGVFHCTLSSETVRFSGLLRVSLGRSALPASCPPARAAWSLCLTPPPGLEDGVCGAAYEERCCADEAVSVTRCWHSGCAVLAVLCVCVGWGAYGLQWQVAALVWRIHLPVLLGRLLLLLLL